MNEHVYVVVCWNCSSGMRTSVDHILGMLTQHAGGVKFW